MLKNNNWFFHDTALIHISGFFSFLCYLLLSYASRDPTDLPIYYFLFLMTLLSIISVALFLYSCHKNRAFSFNAVIGWAIIFRVVGLFSLPIYEDDYYRYLWDGYQFFHNGTPYGVAPSEFFGDVSIPLTFQSVLDGINYPDVPTIYGPIFQYSFLLGYSVFPGEVIGLQIIYCIADIVLIVLLAKICTQRNLILYAWCPLVIKEIAFTAHPDGVGVLLLVGSYVALQHSFYRTAVILLALSVCAKIFALLFVPFVLIRCKFRHGLLFFGTVGLVYLPFIGLHNSDLAGLITFANDWQFNSSIYRVLLQWMTAKQSKLVCLAIFVSVYLIYLFHFIIHKKMIIPRGDWIFGLFFLMAPVVNAWYFIWVLAFATLFPTRWAWTGSLVILLSYVTGLNVDNQGLAPYQQPIWVVICEYGIIGVALCFDTFAWYKKQYRTQNSGYLY